MTDEYKNTLLQNYIIKGIITFNDVANSQSEGAIMKKIIERVHDFKVTAPKDENGRWCTYVPDSSKHDGRRKVSKRTLEELEEYLLEFYQLDKKDGKTFGELFAEFIAYKELFVKAENKGHALSPTTIRRYKRDYDNYLANSSLAKRSMKRITSVDIEKSLLQVIKDNKMKEACAKNVIGYVRQAFAYATRSRVIKENVFEYVDKEILLSHTQRDKAKLDEDRVLTREEVKKLVNAVEVQKKNKPYYMPNYAIELALLTGMRVGEISALKWGDIRDGFIYVDRSEHRIDYDIGYELVIDEPKCLKHRKIPIHDTIIKLLNEIRELNLTSEEDYIFVDRNGKRYNEHTICCATDRRGNEAGIKKCSIHCIRRTVSSELRKVMDIKAVASILGHLETTNEIAYNYDNMEKEAKTLALEQVFSNLLKFERPTNAPKAL